MTSLPQWAPERTVDVARAASLIARAAPALAGQPVTALAEGWDNTVFRVGGDWVFRFPRREMALPGFRRELAVLPRIAARLPLPVPVPEVVGDDDAADPWPFTGARLLPGRELAEAGLSDADRAGVAAEVGAFLRALHGCPVGGLELPVDPMARGWPAARMAHTREHLAALTAAGVRADDPAVEELLAAGERLPAPAGEPVLVHGDLHVRHVVVGNDGRASGVLDWGDVCLADPAVDLSLAYAAFGGPARDALLAAYGEVDAERELRARCLAVRLSALLAEYAAAEGRAALLTESLAGLRRAVLP